MSRDLTERVEDLEATYDASYEDVAVSDLYMFQLRNCHARDNGEPEPHPGAADAYLERLRAAKEAREAHEAKSGPTGDSHTAGESEGTESAPGSAESDGAEEASDDD
ncbi:hypothetical protein [Halobacterium wangiae]|uniref:hypothetical protein n=1 Tax=Halobacterium wangiae TaxID=2902623 RepID=UPI001E28F105|nr:hypothetical protein [Halobacterium wangiae]